MPVSNEWATLIATYPDLTPFSEDLDAGTLTMEDLAALLSDPEFSSLPSFQSDVLLRQALENLATPPTPRVSLTTVSALYRFHPNLASEVDSILADYWILVLSGTGVTNQNLHLLQNLEGRVVGLSESAVIALAKLHLDRAVLNSLQKTSLPARVVSHAGIRKCLPDLLDSFGLSDKEEQASVLELTYATAAATPDTPLEDVIRAIMPF